MNQSATPTPGDKFRRVLLWLTALPLAAGYLGLSTCSPPLSAMDQVRQLGALRVAMTNSPTTYYVGSGGETGFEYDLAQELAAKLGVRLEVVVAESAPDAMRMVQQGRVHFAAAAIGVSPAREQQVRFTPPVQTVVPQLIYRAGTSKPKDLGDLRGSLMVTAGSVHAERLQEIKKTRFPELRWEESEEQGTEDLLYMVANDQLGYTVANSDLLAINQRYYPNLRVAFPIAKSQDIAWAFAHGDDDSLFAPTVAYLEEFDGDELARIRDRHFGHIEEVDSFGALTLALHVESRLVRYREAFEKEAAANDLDWRLLAAMGYQESQWKAEAVSPTGVRGLMQLTTATAARMNVRNREDPFQSIRGGARYFRLLMDQLPPEIAQPDRTWMALAAYNLGIGHLLDARVLTQKSGRDPNRWLDVRASLPLLTKPRWFSQTRYGYARGYEAVTYVGNIRTYYDMLSWLTGGQPTAGTDAPLQPEAAPEPPRDPLNINSPML